MKSAARKPVAAAHVYEVAFRIRKLRMLSCLTQFDLARICAVTPAKVSDWESEVSMPGPLECLALAEISPLANVDYWLELSGFSEQQIALLSFIKPLGMRVRRIA
jgi:transcriptional regulator with XRE-family HTH domain